MEASSNNLSKTQLIFILAALAALGPLSIDMYLPAFPHIRQDLQTTAGPLAATLATFFVGLCLGQLIYGPISDLAGRKKPLLFGLALYTAASLGCALASNIETLLMLRFFQALGSCSGMVVGRALVRDLFPPTETAQVFSMVILAMGTAPILAPLFGQFITAQFGWRAIFYTTAFFAVAVWIAVVRLIPDELGSSKSSSWRLSVFWDILHDRRFLAFALSGAFIQAGLFAYITGFPELFIEQMGFSSRSFSLMFGLNALGLIAASQLNTYLLRHFDYRMILSRVLGIATFSGLLLAIVASTEQQSPLFTLLPLFIFVSSLGFVFPNSTAGALSEQGHRAGSASAILGTIQYGGAALASSAVGWLHQYSAASMEWVIVACALFSSLTYWALFRVRAS